MKKFMIPIALIVMGTGVAFATNAKKSGSGSQTGYRLVSLGGGMFTCDPDKQCTDVTLGPICTWSVDNSTPLNKLESPTSCVVPLHEIIP